MPTIFPIGGGKGGVGKSFVTASLGALLAGCGKSVALVDLDLGASNLHTFLGLPAPQGGLNRFLDKTESQLERVVTGTAVDNLFLISSNNCSMEIANLFHAQKIKLINAIRGLPFDYVLLDLGAGTHFNTLDFFLASKQGIFICTPEPTSIENAFRFIKAVYLRALKHIVKTNNFAKLTKAAVADKRAYRFTAEDIFDLVSKTDPANLPLLKKTIGRFRFHLILNQFRRSAQSNLGGSITAVCNRHFYSPFQFLGRVDFDDGVIDAIYTREPYIDTFPDSPAAMQLKQIGRRLLAPSTGDGILDRVA
ncbi:MAG: P-loop NTPase [Desulfosarcinaceae bacterium]